VATPCGTCGAEPREGARFCDACGSPIYVAPEHAEYKHVTVLFADVVHSMDIAAAVGAERLREIMTDLFKRSALIVERYGGTVDKFTGDGIMALFGAPVALEDHAARACRAALDIQADVRRLAADVERRDDTSFQLRVGLNSDRFWPFELHRSGGTGRPGATDGIGGPCRWRHDYRLHRATG
jgi:adenylate cyclase